MTTLTSFRAALLDADQPVPAGLIDSAGLPAGRRYAVYRNNIAVSLTDALATGFPAVARLIGDDMFRAVAGVFLRQYQPVTPITPIMTEYGTGFPEFLAGFGPLGHIGYLADVARLELALRRSYHAADTTPVPVATLQSLSPERLMTLRLTLAPTLFTLRAAWPVVSIWRYTLEPDQPKPAPVAQDALITRPEFDPIVQPLPAGGADFIDALRDHALGDAYEIAARAAPDFDLTQTLGLLMSGNAIIDISEVL